MKLGFIGIGNMGNAILKGYLTANPGSEKAIFAYDKDQDRLKSVSEQTGINACDSVPSVVEKSDIVILAIKPDIFGQVLNEVAAAMDWEKKIIVSIAAGITLNLSLIHISTQPLQLMWSLPADPTHTLPSLPPLVRLRGPSTEERTSRL